MMLFDYREGRMFRVASAHVTSERRETYPNR